MSQGIIIPPFDPNDKCRGPLIGHSKMKPGDTPDKLLRKAKKKQDKEEQKRLERREHLGL